MTPLLAAHHLPTANDRFKEAFPARVWASLILATLLHVLPFRFSPVMEVDDWARKAAEVAEVIQLTPPDLPEAPAEIRKPGVPVVAPDLDVSETLPTVDWETVPELAPPAPVAERSAVGNDGAFVAHTVSPKLQNPDAVQRALEREYPPNLRDAGLGGVVTLLVHVGEDGAVTEIRVGEGSGYSALDRAALRVAETMRFSPAMNYDMAVAVWTEFSVTFRVR